MPFEREVRAQVGEKIPDVGQVRFRPHKRRGAGIRAVHRLEQTIREGGEQAHGVGS